MTIIKVKKKKAIANYVKKCNASKRYAKAVQKASNKYN